MSRPIVLAYALALVLAGLLTVAGAGRARGQSVEPAGPGFVMGTPSGPVFVPSAPGTPLAYPAGARIATPPGHAPAAGYYPVSYGGRYEHARSNGLFADTTDPYGRPVVVGGPRGAESGSGCYGSTYGPRRGRPGPARRDRR